MKNPASTLKRLLGDRVTSVSILGETIDLLQEVAIPRDVPLEDLLYDHAERVALWERFTGVCRRKLQKLQDEMEEWKGRRFIQFWSANESSERAEMTANIHDEDELDKDQFSPGRRAKRTQSRVQSGYYTGRWRRNFTDDLIHGFVNSDEKIVTLKKELRSAQHDLDIALAMRKAMEARGMSLNHLCALHRDLARQ